MRFATRRFDAARRAMLATMLAVFAASSASGIPLEIPLQLDPPFLRAALVEQLFRDSGQTARVLDDGLGCNELVLSHPVVFGEDGLIRLRMAMQSRFGTPVGGRCALPLDTSRDVELTLRPAHREGSPVVAFRIVDSRILARGAGPVAISSGLIWDAVKQHVHPYIGAYRIDLASPLADLRGLLPEVVGPADEARVRAIADSVALVTVGASAAGVRATLRAEIPPLPGGPPAAPTEAPLTAEEHARFAQAVGRFDGFLTQIVKSVGAGAGTREDRDELLAILIDARGDMLTALDPAQPRRAAEGDPVQALFRSTWARLAPVLRRLAGSAPEASGLRLLGLVASGDALIALDRAGRETGFELSENGLRRMARLVAPATEGDPLATPDRVDPALREIFGFGAPLEPMPESPDTGDPAPREPAAGEVAPGETAPNEASPAEPAPAEPAPAVTPPEPQQPTSSFPSRLPEFALRAPPGTACAASDDGAPSAGEPAWSPLWIEPIPLADLSRQLRHFVPAPADLDRYLPLVRDVLQRAAQLTLDKLSLDPSVQPAFRWLVLATAWKESCWRQFVRERGAVTPIRSPVGALGMMQINPHVWRGFYDVAALGADTVYNARAGSEILHHYLRDFALAQGEQNTQAGIDGAVRATYAAYNGGPRHLRRWRRPGTPKSLRRIDEAFFARYQAVRDGREFEVRTCLGG